MTPSLKNKIIETCEFRIGHTGPDINISLYAFFPNENDNPKLLMEAATWWIEKMRFDQFEKAGLVLAIVKAGA